MRFYYFDTPPPTHARIDWEHPLARDIAFCVPFATSLGVDLVSGIKGTLQGSATINGQGFVAGTNAADYISWPTSLGYSLFNNRAYPVTASFGFTPNSSTGNNILGLIWGSVGGDQIVYIGKETSTLVAAIKGETTSYYSIWSAGSGVFSAGVKAHTSVAFKSKTSAIMMVNAKQYTPTASPGNANQLGGEVSPTGILSCGYTKGGSAPLNGLMQYIYVHFRTLSTDEQISLNLAPYQMFYTESPVFYSIPQNVSAKSLLLYYASIRK